ncbi:MAG TPA: glycoside hydrolase family 3 N-terminal domain-containing protein [Frankiaceae bacterium]|nr:glycoside hydrolase family 3 N-terminal domain-containing protein [Frankiaceae bacterium]
MAIGVCLLGVLPFLGCSAVVVGSPAQEAPGPASPPCRPAPLTARAAAVLVAGLPDTQDPDDELATSLPKLGVGGVLLTQRNVRSPEQVSALTSALRKRSARPLYITTDEEGGQVSTFRPLLGTSSSAYSVGGGDPARLFARGQLLGTFLRGLGVSGDLAPVADVTTGSASAIGSRSFSADPATASSDALAVARGLAASGVTPTLKHFPGLGRPESDTHTEVTVVDAARADLESTDLAPFHTAIGQGVPVVMVSHASYPSLGITGPASLSPTSYALLRKLGFQGVAMTDSLGMGAVNLRYDYPEAAVQALRAGADALLFTDGTQAKRMRDALVSAVQHGRLSAARLDDAAARVTALAGGDAEALTCQDVQLPTLR